jgi:hypothetical protein
MDRNFLYGIAVIFIALSALLIFSRPASVDDFPFCRFDSPGLVCDQPSAPLLNGGTGEMKGALGNRLGRSILVLQIGCTADAGRQPSPTDLAKSRVYGSKGLAFVNNYSGGLALAAGGETGFGITCTDSSGEKAASVSGGKRYDGFLFVRYRFEGDSAIGFDRVERAKLRADAR